ncbi:UNVERIFIED_CONTAM: hypothetical protein RKD43_004165 [Streptomyces graminofaciens]
MRKWCTVLAVLGLTGLTGLTGLAVAAPATAQTASQDRVAAAAASCDPEWPGRNGSMYAWRYTGCEGLLGSSQGNDPNWGDSSGPFQGSDNNAASSVMNAGYVGGNDVVAFYRLSDYQWSQGYGCLLPGEYYADDLSDNRFQYGGSLVIDNNITSHKWVNANECLVTSIIT